jgi:hypothetical protein
MWDVDLTMVAITPVDPSTPSEVWSATVTGITKIWDKHHVTYIGKTPNAQWVRLDMNITDKAWNIVNNIDTSGIKQLFLENQSPEIEDPDNLITLNWGGSSWVNYTITWSDVSDDSTPLSDLVLVNKWFNTSKWSVVKTWTNIVITRIDWGWDVDGSPDNNLAIAFEDAQWSESDVLTFTVNNVNDF